ncbi:hypothetical protein ABZV77_11135 [Streptomyces sp. NPDC004732]|uniref:hypothetical protein n=1 Tax=Streptomyces sp. NPDC004732 TaxID=3154290 RepID=UPI0033B5F73B
MSASGRHEGQDLVDGRRVVRHDEDRSALGGTVVEFRSEQHAALVERRLEVDRRHAQATQQQAQGLRGADLPGRVVAAESHEQRAAGEPASVQGLLGHVQGRCRLAGSGQPRHGHDRSRAHVPAHAVVATVLGAGVLAGVQQAQEACHLNVPAHEPTRYGRQ